MQKDMQSFFNGAYGYFEDQFVEAINGTVPWIPQQVAEWIAEIGLGAGLDLTYDLTKKFTGQHFEDEMRGLADGCACGVTVQQIRRVHMIGAPPPLPPLLLWSWLWLWRPEICAAEMAFPSGRLSCGYQPAGASAPGR